MTAQPASSRVHLRRLYRGLAGLRPARDNGSSRCELELTSAPARLRSDDKGQGWRVAERRGLDLEVLARP